MWQTKQWLDEAVCQWTGGNPVCGSGRQAFVWDEEWNVNGSYAAIEGITSSGWTCIRQDGVMQRDVANSVAINIYGEQDLKIFESGVAYFK